MNTTNYGSSESHEDADGMFTMHTFSNVCYPADRCVLCSSGWHIKHLVVVLGDGTAWGWDSAGWQMLGSASRQQKKEAHAQSHNRVKFIHD